MTWVVCRCLILHNAAIASVSTWKANQGLWCVESGHVWLWFQATFPLSPFQFRCPWQWEVLATSQTGRHMLASFPDPTQLSSMLGESLRTRYTVVSWKSAHGWSTLQVCQRGGWALFRLFSHLTTKEHPRHVYSNLKPSEQIIERKITYNGTTSSFEVESWRHTTLWTVRCDGDYSVACG